MLYLLPWHCFNSLSCCRNGGGIMLLMVMCLTSHGACEPTPTPQPIDNRACPACLDHGGTWRPEVQECTQDCAIMDISCFTDDCPEACSSDNCSDCFDQTSCETAQCAWRQEDEIAWCH